MLVLLFGLCMLPNRVIRCDMCALCLLYVLCVWLNACPAFDMVCDMCALLLLFVWCVVDVLSLRDSC